MSHDYHEAHPSYSPAQVLHDGCGECDMRSRMPNVAIGHLDPVRFAAAWHRAADFGRGQVDDASDAEVPVLHLLWAVQVQLERRGIPIGVLPILRLDGSIPDPDPGPGFDVAGGAGGDLLDIPPNRTGENVTTTGERL